MQFKLYFTSIRMAKIEMPGSTNIGKNVPLNVNCFNYFGEKKIASFSSDPAIYSYLFKKN